MIIIDFGQGNFKELRHQIARHKNRTQPVETDHQKPEADFKATQRPKDSNYKIFDAGKRTLIENFQNLPIRAKQRQTYPLLQ